MNKTMIVLAVIADLALVINVVHHWHDHGINTVQVFCGTNQGKTFVNCAIVPTYDESVE